MPGILDYLTGNNGAASPWGMLYPSPLLDPTAQLLQATGLGRAPDAAAYPNAQMLQAQGQAPAAPDAAAYGAMGVDPSAFMQPTPPVSPFQEQQQPAPTPPATGFGAGASPFGFAGPGSMSGVNPANFAPPAPAPAPQVAAAPSTDLSSVNRPAPAPATNDPIAVGNYQMPRVGGGFPADDGEEDTPANAKPTQGVMPGAPQSQAAPFSLAGAGAGAGDRLGAAGRGFLGNLNAGPIGALLAGAGSLLTGRESDPTTIATSKQTQADNANARALLAKNVDPAVVQAAILGARSGQPGLLNTLITQNFGPEKFQHVSIKNADGSETPQAFDTSTGKYSGAVAAPQGRFSVDENLTGQARLDALRKADPDYARRIESMVNGDIPLPTGVAALKPNADRMIKDVLAVDGSTSASDFATRAATRKDYASGVASRVTKSLNTTIEHADRLDKAIDQLGNYTYFPSITNAIHNAYGSNLDPKYQAARSNFESAKEAFIKELDFTLSGGHSSVSGSAELRDKINRADSPEALHAAIQTDLHLLAARLDSHTTGFTQGTKSQRDPQDFLYPKNRPTFNRLMGSTDTSSGQSVPGVSADAGAPAGANGGNAIPPPGSYVWTPSGGLSGGK